MIEKLNEEVEILINEKNRSFDDSINFSFFVKNNYIKNDRGLFGAYTGNYLKKKLDEVINDNVISLEEIALINKLKELINNGFVLALPAVINWYEKRNMKDNIAYLKYKQQQYFYNLKENWKKEASISFKV